jgi:hypothetical protein
MLCSTSGFALFRDAKEYSVQADLTASTTHPETRLLEEVGFLMSPV